MKLQDEDARLGGRECNVCTILGKILKLTLRYDVRSTFAVHTRQLNGKTARSAALRGVLAGGNSQPAALSSIHLELRDLIFELVLMC